MLKKSRRAFLAASLASAGTVVLPGWRPLRAATPRFTSNPFKLGVASGFPTSSSVVLWTRIAPSPLEPGGGVPPGAVSVQWEIATDDKMTKVVRTGTHHATEDWAHSVHAEPSGLEPAREYWYRFTAGGIQSPIGRTKTAPAANAETGRLKLAIASCQQYEHGYFSAYRHMLADNLDLIVHVGDYIYELTRGENLVRSHGTPEALTLNDYRARHALYKSDPDLAAAHATYPWLVTWDDHEVNNDYAGTTSALAVDPKVFIARRAAAYRAYYEHMPLPRGAIPSRNETRIYSQRAFGNLASLFMLDQRQYRSPEACRDARQSGNRINCAELDDPSRTMLGRQQEQWLQKSLSATHARWNLLAQGTVMAHIDEVPAPERLYSADDWNGYPVSRAKLLAFLAERRIPNPVVLAGDVHAYIVSNLNREPANPDSPVVASELVTTSITSQGTSQRLLNRRMAANPNMLFANGEVRGYLRLDVTHQRLLADLVGLSSEKQPQSTTRILKSFAIENGRPGPVAV